MKKQKLTVNQIETLKNGIRCTIHYHSNEPEKISKKLKQIDDFLKMAADLYIIEDYSEVTKIMKEIGEAALSEYELNKKRA